MKVNCKMKNKHAQSLGKKGGKRILELRGAEYFKELSKKAVEAKREKMAINRV
jgi:hypothetical protein